MRHGAGRVDQAAQLVQVGEAGQAGDGHLDLCRVSEEGVAVPIDQAGGLQVAVQALGAERAAGGRAGTVQDAEQHQHQQAGAVGRALPDLHAAPGRLDGFDELGAGAAGGEVGLGVQAAVGAERGDHVGGDGALVEAAGALLGDGAQGFGQGLLAEQVSGPGRVAAG